jgi:beta-glucanase (GH16 family)
MGCFGRSNVSALSRRGVYRQPINPLPGNGLTKTFDYVPSRDGLALLTGGPTDAGYATNAAANPTRKWQPRVSIWGTSSAKGNADVFSGNYQLNIDPEFAWSNAFTPFSFDGNGNLRIRAQTTSTAGFAGGEIPTNTVSGATYSYVSGVISSKNTFTQQGGYIEFVAQVPTGYACWPAFWMLPFNDVHPPEVDILEVTGGSTGITTAAYFASSHSQEVTNNSNIVTAAQDLGLAFHKYALSWTDTALQFYYDNTQVANINITTQPDFGQAFYLIVNNQIGSTISGWTPIPNGTTPAIADVLIKSIRVWQYPGPVNLSLSALAYLDNVTVGGTVATISATNFGGNSSYTFADISDPDSMFTVSGSNLNLAQVVLATTKNNHNVTLQVTDGLGRSRQRLFNLGVITAAPIQANYITTQDLTNAYWAKGALTASTSDTLLETATTADHSFNVTSTITRTAAVKTFETWVDATASLTTPWINFQIFDSTFGNSAQAWYNVAGAAIGFFTQGGSFLSTTPFVTALPSGRVRCGFTFVTDGTSTGFHLQIHLATGQDGTPYAGNTGHGMKFDNIWLYNTGAGAGGS